MKAIIEAALFRGRSTLSALVILLIAGIYSYITIPKEAEPDIDIPIMYVSITLEGISPDDAERLLIRPMEEELSSVDGVKELRATGFQGGANIILEFTAGFNAKKALDDVRIAVDKAKPELPEDADEPIVNEVNFSLFPVLVVTLSGDVPERTLLAAARNLQDRIETVPAVLEANIAGNRDEQIEIIVDPVKIESYGLSGRDIIAFFQRSSKLVAAGNIDTGAGRFAVKVPGLFETLNDIETMPLKVSGDSAVLVRDIAEIRRNFKDPETFARINGRQAVAIEIVKRSGENIIETVAAIRKIVAEDSALWPSEIQVNYTQDRSQNIRQMLGDLQNSIASAVILVMIVCVLALGLTTSSLVGITIPAAFLMGIFFLSLSGLTVNIVVLFSLILSVGIVVDGTLVVAEYADRKMAEGLSRQESYREAAVRMSWPVISSTLTILAAFFPLLFWPGIVGEFMRYMPITLIAVLLSALAVALLFVPVLGALFGRHGMAGDTKVTKSLSVMEEGDLAEVKGATGAYIRLLRQVLTHPGKIILLAIVFLFSIQFYYARHGNGVEFFPDREPEVASILVHARGNLSIYEQDKLVQAVEKRVLAIAGIETVYSRTGRTGGGNDLAEDVIGQIQIEFADWNRRAKAAEILQEIRDKTTDISGIYVEPQEEKAGPQSGKALQLQIHSRFPETLAPAIEKILGGLREIEGFVDIEDSRPLPGIEWALTVDRAQAAKFGLDTSSIGQSVRLVTNGLKISEFRPLDSKKEIDVLIRYPQGSRSLERLDRVRIETPNGSIPITNFVTRTAQPKTGQISRADGFRIMTIKADVPPGVNADAKIRALQDWMQKQEWDPRLRFVFKGQDEDQKESQKFLIEAFIAAIFIIGLIMVTQFNSFYSCFLILSAIIMSTIGVLLGLLIMGRPFGVVMTGLGVIALAGTIVSNNIILIDTYDTLRKTGRFTPFEAALRTGAQRLRPVFLTAVTTALGLLPMAFQLNIDFINRVVEFGGPSTQWWADLSTAIAFGIFFATPLTLLVTPAALVFKENLSGFCGRLYRRYRPRQS